MLQYDKALDHFKQSLKIYKKASLNECKDGDVAKTLCTIGFCFKDMHQSKNALTYFNQALSIYKAFRSIIRTASDIVTVCDSIEECNAVLRGNH